MLPVEMNQDSVKQQTPAQHKIQALLPTLLGQEKKAPQVEMGGQQLLQEKGKKTGSGMLLTSTCVILCATRQGESKCRSKLMRTDGRKNTMFL